MDLALNKEQRLTCHKPKQIKKNNLGMVTSLGERKL